MTYGIIGPFEAEADISEIRSEMKVLNSTSKVITLTKVNINKMRSFIKIKFEGPLPLDSCRARCI